MRMNQMLFGRRVYITAAPPNMQCSPEFVRLQDYELVRSTNEWMAEFFGRTDLVPDGVVYDMPGENAIAMNAATWEKTRKAMQP